MGEHELEEAFRALRFGLDSAVRQRPTFRPMGSSTGSSRVEHMTTVGVLEKRGDEMGGVALPNEYDRAKADLVQALSQFAGLQALMDRFQGQEPPVGTVLRWVKTFNEPQGDLILDRGAGLEETGRIRFNIEGGQEYHFVAFRAPNGKWYTTSQRGRDVSEWSELLKRIGDSPCELVSDWVEVPVPAKPDMSAVDPVEFARKMFGKQPTTVEADEKSS